MSGKIRTGTCWLAMKLAIAACSALMLSACIGGGSGGSSGGGSQSPHSTVQAPPEGNEELTLSWRAPATRVDGSSLYLYELAGYEILYGTVDGKFSWRLDVRDQYATSATLRNLKSGLAYYIMVRVYDVEGRYSGYSAQQVVTIR